MTSWSTPTANARTGRGGELDPWTDVLTRRLGGPLGRHAAPGGSWQDGALWLILISAMTWIVLMMRQLPCRQTVVGKTVDTFGAMCYSDIPVLYQVRGQAQGQLVYLQTPWEYPVLSGALVEVARFLTDLLGYRSGPGVQGQAALDHANVYFAVTAVLLYGCFVALVEVHRRLAGSHGWRTGLMLAASPIVIAEGLINWDLLAVMLTSVAIYQWARRRPGWAGVVLGLAIAAKLYPLFLLGPLLLLCLRAGKLEAYGKVLVGAAGSWLAVNLPLYLATPSGWTYFWTFNSDRGADLGSVWYVLKLGGVDLSVGMVGALSFGLFAAMCATVAMLCVVAPQRPRLGQVAFLVVAAFLMVNKVYSPQYALWLLPLLLLARPVVRDVVVYTVAELAYFAAIWGHLAGTLTPGGGGPDRIYWLAVLIRVGVSLWLCVLVSIDILSPAEDPLRGVPAPGESLRDDEVGGVLDAAPDTPFFARLAAMAGPDPRPGADPPPQAAE
ncbi:MAG TPA: glycosyltransferase 87 family protein [Propionibacteriaceae bacterium]|nr:glycosyltransferase 87 family protein [Propionibacteriaceae bacterium]